jgi:hypothetical protein
MLVEAHRSHKKALSADRVVRVSLLFVLPPYMLPLLRDSDGEVVVPMPVVVVVVVPVSVVVVAAAVVVL